MKVPLLDLQAQFVSLRAPLLSAIERVMDAQHFILGAEVHALEKEIAKYSRTRHAIGCASGSNAVSALLIWVTANEIFRKRNALRARRWRFRSMPS